MLTYGSVGEPWILVSGGRAERVRGPIYFEPEGGAAGALAFSIQAGAFSQEEPARRKLERVAGD
jgi:hypothetical protein